MRGLLVGEASLSGTKNELLISFWAAGGVRIVLLSPVWSTTEGLSSSPDSHSILLDRHKLRTIKGQDSTSSPWTPGL